MSMQELATTPADRLEVFAGAPQVLGVSTDSIEDELKRLAATYEHAGIGIAEVDAEGKFLRVNPQLCDLMGYAADELLGRSIFEESLAEDVVADGAQFGRQVAGEIDRYSIEKRLRRKDGAIFWALITSASVRDETGRFLYAVRVQQDITDRKQAQESLARRAEEQATLYGFTERLQRAETIEEVFAPALDAIMQGLRCQRASVLLFYRFRVVRFVAWR